MDQNPYSSPDVASGMSPLQSLYSLARIFVALMITGVVVALLMPPVSRGRTLRSICKSNLKQIGLALANYHDQYGAFPPPYTVDADGHRLHSWRTLLLPFLDRQELYRKVDLSKPWDDAVNREVWEQNSKYYSPYFCPSSLNTREFTSYVAIVSDRSCFAPDKSLRYTDIKDGASNTLMIVEVDADLTIPWMAPQDADESLLAGLDAKQRFHHTGGLHVLMADGTVRFINAKTDKSTLHALITRAAADAFGNF